jgi:general secretion pathway protein D
MLRCVVPFLLAGLLSACSSNDYRPDPASGDEYLVEVERLKAEVKRKPLLVENRTRLARMEAQATRFFYEGGSALLNDGVLEGALREFQKGLLVSPKSEKLSQAVASVMVKIEAERFYSEGMRSIELERVEEARKAFSTSLKLVPGHFAASRALQNMQQIELQATGPLDSKEAVTLSFQEADIRTVYEFLGKAFGLNVLFDEGVKNTPVTLFAEGVTVKQALELLTTNSETFFKQVGPNTLLIVQENPQKRAQYDEFLIRTFYLRIIPAKDMAAIIKGVLSPKQMIISEQLNSVMVRDTESVLGLVENVIKNNDLRPAELILDVEILEMNRSKVEQLGVDYGSRISLNFPQTEKSIGDAIAGGTYTLPAFTLQYLKQDVDARTLANPKIRVAHGSSAKIHIGDRIPLRSSTIQDATGQVRTTFEYRDVGIRLAVEPHIHLDNSVSVKLALEVSSLGQNLGTQNEPAYSIGTRNAETEMLLRDGETAVLGGLIRDDDRNSVTGLPGLSALPVMGRLFRVDDGNASTTDVLLTITPQIVRAWELPEHSAREVYSGTERRYTDEKPFAEMATMTTGGPAPVISVVGDTAGLESSESDVDESNFGGEDGPQDPGEGAATLIDPLPEPTPRSATPVKPVEAEPSQPKLSFGAPLYKAAVGGELPIEVLYTGPHQSGSVEFHVLYNPRIIEFVKEEAVAGGMSVSVVNDGTAVVTVPSIDEAYQAAVVGRLMMRPLANGSSYLAYRIPQAEGDYETVSIQTTSARIEIE